MTYQRYELAPLHDGGELLAALAAGADLLPEQVPGGEVGVAVLGHDAVALGPLAATRAAQHPHDGQLGLPQRGLVNVSSGNVSLQPGEQAPLMQKATTSTVLLLLLLLLQYYCYYYYDKLQPGKCLNL